MTTFVAKYIFERFYFIQKGKLLYELEKALQHMTCYTGFQEMYRGHKGYYKYRSFIVLLYQYLWHVYATHNVLLWINLVCKYTSTVSYTLSNDLVLVEQEVIILPKHQSSLPLGFVEFYLLFSTQCLLDDCLSMCSSSFGYYNVLGIFWLSSNFWFLITSWESSNVSLEECVK